MYSLRTISILIGMIITGACRSVGVKATYQLNLANPTMVVFLYLIGQALSIFVYLWCECRQKKKTKQSSSDYYDSIHDKTTTLHCSKGAAIDDDDDDSSLSSSTNNNDDNDIIESFVDEASLVDTIISSKLSEEESIEETAEIDDDDNDESTIDDNWLEENHSKDDNDLDDDTKPIIASKSSSSLNKKGKKRRRRGSGHGLNHHSIEAVSWVHRIPKYVKPAVSGCFNFGNAILRWATYVYVPASIADMLIAGSELVLSVIAARLIRKRLVSGMRWIGVSVVTVGLLLVGLVHTMNSSSSASQTTSSNSDDTSNIPHHWIGNILIFGQSIMSVLQDISEELFLQESEFPPTLLLGLEGIYGLLFGGLMYGIYTLVLGLQLPEIVVSSSSSATFPSSVGDTGLPLTTKVLVGFAMAFWFLLTGVLNILMTEATSSMTRNVWKNVRIFVVWMMSLLLFYYLSSPNSNTSTTTEVVIGEEWQNPQSLVVLLGYVIMLFGIYWYYK